MYFQQFTPASLMTVSFDASETSLNSLKVAHFQSHANICNYSSIIPLHTTCFLESRRDDDDGYDNKVIAHTVRFWTIDFKRYLARQVKREGASYVDIKPSTPCLGTKPYRFFFKNNVMYVRMDWLINDGD